MTLAECFAEFGGDFDGAMSRLRSEALLKKFVLKFLEDSSFATLERALQSGDGEGAFRAAHTLKGVCLNLGVSRLAESASQLTEALRHGIMPEANVLFGKAKADYEATVSAISKLA